MPLTPGRFSDSRSKRSSSSSLRPPSTPTPDPFPLSQRWPDPHGRHPKRPALGIALNRERDSEDAKRRRRLLLEMEDWTGAQAQKPLKMTFPSANPDAPVWGWSGEAEAEAQAGVDINNINNSTGRHTGSRPGSASYSAKSVTKYSPRHSFPPSSSTTNARSSHPSRPSLRTPFTAHAPERRSSPISQPVSGTLSAGERERFESDGVGILSPSGVPAASGLLDTPGMSALFRAPKCRLEDRLEELRSVGSQESNDQQRSPESSTDLERTPSDLPEDLNLDGDSEPDDSEPEGFPEEEEERDEDKDKAEGLEETTEEFEVEKSEDDVEDEVEQTTEAAESDTDVEMEESEGESIVSSEQDIPVETAQVSPQESSEDYNDDGVQLVPLEGQKEETFQEEQAHDAPTPSPPRQKTRRTRVPGSRPAPMLARDTSTLSEASRAAALFEAQRVTIREIPDCNDIDDPIEDSESEREMMRRAKSAQTMRGRRRGTRGLNARANTRRRGWC